jgi:hypothetical protein
MILYVTQELYSLSCISQPPQSVSITEKNFGLRVCGPPIIKELDYPKLLHAAGLHRIKPKDPCANLS